MILQHVAGPGHPQGTGKHPYPPHRQQVSPALPQVLVVGPLVQNVPFHRAVVLLPLVLNVDQGPLPAAELEMLETGELEEVLLLIGHPIRIQATPAGSFSSSTVTV